MSNVTLWYKKHMLIFYKCCVSLMYLTLFLNKQMVSAHITSLTLTFVIELFVSRGHVFVC